ncbi:MAG: CpaD family pilus assembly lipoprotein [Alphaproteobacteria bacterium]|nr:CpaD family pilus assembly lipoprotein [Alphaproteobacteria bacterium]
MRLSSTLFAFGLLTLTGCVDIYEPTLKPDYTIRVMPTENGMVATPPDCPSWSKDVANPFDNQPVPQFGCASARNLAIMVERPEDLVQGRELGPADAAISTNAMSNYRAGTTRGLIDPGKSDSQAAITTAPSPSAASSSSGSGGASGAP